MLAFDGIVVVVALDAPLLEDPPELMGELELVEPPLVEVPVVPVVEIAGGGLGCRLASGGGVVGVLSSLPKI